MKIPKLYSPTDMAREIGTTRSRVNYLIYRHGIMPVAVVGSGRLFGEKELKRLRELSDNVRPKAKSQTV